MLKNDWVEPRQYFKYIISIVCRETIDIVLREIELFITFVPKHCDSAASPIKILFDDTS